MTGHTVLMLENIGVKYRKSRSILRREYADILHDISFSIMSGESIGILGRNGAGKSTLLKVIAGIIRPDAGRVRNHAVKCALLNLQIGFNKELTGNQNIMLMGILLGFRKQEIRSQQDAIVQFSELGGSIDNPVKTYSAGMRARLGFSIAMHLKTDVLLIDEVFSVGDIKFREKSSNAMKEMLVSDQTVVLVSHQAQTIKNLCNRAVWIENGTVRQVGPAVEVIDAYERYILA